MVITESNTTNSVGKLLPELEGKLTGDSISVSVLNVSMAVRYLTVERDATREEANEDLRNISLNGAMQRQVDYTVSSEAVSTGLTVNRNAGIEDSYAIIVNKRDVVIYFRFYGAFGYTCQVIRIAQKMAGVLYPTAPVQPLIHYRSLKDIPNLKSVLFCWQNSALLFIISPRVRAS